MAAKKAKKDQAPAIHFDGVWFEAGQVMARIAVGGEKPQGVILLDWTRSVEERECLLEDLTTAIQEWIEEAREEEGEEGD